jgi:hypothetical protein
VPDLSTNAEILFLVAGQCLSRQRGDKQQQLSQATPAQSNVVHSWFSVSLISYSNVIWLKANFPNFI